ncbi:uncharacterized protein QC761_0020590 [Podospora bellae-mahoneyi]|uniref:Uncharacterized protein n=1 Tax=Podospora bellae-mahoneyi TaxID=2093777 RepID=A0ABR0G0U7_9PEZI|nr:hypothetical protein QC761_0020590 [Podospora bellae-mahoneyi]
MLSIIIVFIFIRSNIRAAAHPSTPVTILVGRRALGGILPIPLGRSSTEILALPCHEQKGESAAQGKEASHDEAVLETHVGIPGRDSIGNGETHQVADQDNSGGGVARDILVAVNVVRESNRATSYDTGSQNTETDGQNCPVSVMLGTNTPHDKADGSQDSRHKKGPETVLGLTDAVVPAGKPQGELIGNGTSPVAANGRADDGTGVDGADKTGRPVVGSVGENRAGSSVQDLVPAEVDAVDETGPEDDGELVKVNEGHIHGLEHVLVGWSAVHLAEPHEFLGEGGLDVDGSRRFADGLARAAALLSLLSGIGGGSSSSKLILLILQTLQTLAEIHGLLHEEKHDDEGHGSEDGTKVHGPLPSIRLVEPAANQGSQEVGAEERKDVHAHHGTALMGKKDVGDADLG